MNDFATQKIDYDTHEKPTDFVRLEQGDNTIRVVSDGYLLRRHQFKHGGQFITLPFEGQGCKHCEKSGEPVVRYAWVVLVRGKEHVRMMEAGTTVGEALIEIGKEKELKSVDIVIHRKGEGMKTRYTITEATKTEPISDEVVEDIKTWVPIYIKKYIKHV